MTPTVDIAQTTWEFDQLLDVLDWTYVGPPRVLEIGVWEGGTLFYWLKWARDAVSAIDDTMRPPGPDEWQAWAADANVALTLLHGRSDDPAIIDQARALGPYGFVFIDGDHTYQAVKADWENYRGMVAPGGLVAFHDITERPDYGVSQLWGEIKAEPGARTLEIVENSGRYNGIGVVAL